MKIAAFLMILFGIIIISFPEFLSYLVGGFFVVLGINIAIGIFMLERRFKSTIKGQVYNSEGEKEVMNIFGYKIYKK